MSNFASPSKWISPLVGLGSKYQLASSVNITFYLTYTLKRQKKKRHKLPYLVSDLWLPPNTIRRFSLHNASVSYVWRAAILPIFRIVIKVCRIWLLMTPDDLHVLQNQKSSFSWHYASTCKEWRVLMLSVVRYCDKVFSVWLLVALDVLWASPKAIGPFLSTIGFVLSIQGIHIPSK